MYNQIDRLYKPHILQLDQYVSSRQNINNDYIFLDWNESYFDNKALKKYIRKNIAHVNKYTDPFLHELKEKISNYLSETLYADNIQIFNGSDSALKTVFDCFCSPGTLVYFNSPDYDQVITFIKTNQGIITNNISEADIVYISNPNNPLGILHDKEKIKKLITTNKLIIIDEAYIDFAGNEHSFVSYLGFDNVIITRTFSKAFGIAGLRLGYIVSNERIINYINKIRNIKEVNNIAVLAGNYLLTNFNIKKYVKCINECKRQLYDVFDKKNIVYNKTVTNFIPLYLTDIPLFIKLMDKHKILFRDKRDHGILRMTIGNKETTSKIINIIENEYE